MNERTSDLRVTSFIPLLAPIELKRQLPLSEGSAQTVVESRRAISAILAGHDSRLFAVVGPCSIHDPEAGLEYASRLYRLAQDLSSELFIVMRIYFEKPRTRLGWRGLILDPELDGSYNIERGLQKARRFLLDVTGIGMCAGSEMLDPIVPQYIDDLVSWASIGARTTESQTHREMASGLSMPVGFKNGTDGSVETAINAMASSLHPHSFIGLDQQGGTCVVNTTGNHEAHVIMRGGKSGPNYYPWDIVRTEELLRHGRLPMNIVVDCSHGNSDKDYRRQPGVLRSIVEQVLAGRRSIKGFMLESNLVDGRQEPEGTAGALVYGQSVTDACIGWEETERLLTDTAEALAARVVQETQ